MDVLGERWTLLVLRELALGPRRYKDLGVGLPGIGTNLLAARLRSLEAAGVVRRITLPEPANVPAYELTERGEQLWSILEDLAVWGYELLPETPADEDTAHPSWGVLTMAAVLKHHGPGDVRGTFVFVVGDERVHLVIDDTGARVRQGLPARADARMEIPDPEAFLALATQRTTPSKAAEDGLVSLEGDAVVLDSLFERFHLPVSAAA
jgi:DNA-binding HxlR family transcriptional regulator